LDNLSHQRSNIDRIKEGKFTIIDFYYQFSFNSLFKTENLHSM